LFSSSTFVVKIATFAKPENVITNCITNNNIMSKKWDVFISHASEDKELFVRPLAKALADRKIKVWYDEFELKLGDSLRTNIDIGLARSRFGIIILSPSFFKKKWTNSELNAFFSKEGSRKVILPIWHNISSTDLLDFSPILSDLYALSSDSGIEHIVNSIVDIVSESKRTTPAKKAQHENPYEIIQLFVGGTIHLTVDKDKLNEFVKSISINRSITTVRLISLIRYSLNQISRKQWFDGELKGGWGKDYGNIYFTPLFGEKKPNDSIKHEHSISFTTWVLDGLVDILENDLLFNNSENYYNDNKGWLNEIKLYLIRHFDQSTGGVGPRWSGVDSTIQIAPNIRHASAAILAFMRIPGMLFELEKSSHYFLSNLKDVKNWSDSRGLTLATILKGLYAIRRSELLAHSLFTNKGELTKLISSIEIELLNKISDLLSNQNRKTTLWYAAFILSSVPEIQQSFYPDLKEAYAKVLDKIIIANLRKADKGVGLPYLPGEQPDIGISSLVLLILLNDESINTYNKKDLINELLTFIVKHFDDERHNKYSYSWLWAITIKAISVTCTKNAGSIIEKTPIS